MGPLLLLAVYLASIAIKWTHLLLNPLDRHDASKHHFVSLKYDVIFWNPGFYSEHFHGTILIITVYFLHLPPTSNHLYPLQGGGPRVVVSTAAFHARVRGSVPSLGGLKETKLFLPHPRVKVSIVGSLRDREVACSASDHQGSNFESCVWRTVSSQSSHHPQEVLLAQFSLYVHKGGLKPDSFHFISIHYKSRIETASRAL